MVMYEVYARLEIKLHKYFKVIFHRLCNHTFKNKLKCYCIK